MMENYEIVEFIAIMERLIDKFTFPLKVSVQSFQQAKKSNKNLDYIWCFLFLNWKVWSFKTFTVFFWCQKPPAEEMIDLECLQICHTAFNDL